MSSAETRIGAGTSLRDWTNVERQRASFETQNGRSEDRPFHCDPSLEVP